MKKINVIAKLIIVISILGIAISSYYFYKSDNEAKSSLSRATEEFAKANEAYRQGDYSTAYTSKSESDTYSVKNNTAKEVMNQATTYRIIFIVVLIVSIIAWISIIRTQHRGTNRI